jgi:hypothetical protein
MTPDYERAEALVDSEPTGELIIQTNLQGYKLILMRMRRLSSHLWQLDIIANRTLVYVTLTSALALIYLGSVLLIQQFFPTLTQEEWQLVLISTTLAIISLFQPLRRRLQKVIDRYFYRRKYSASQTLEVFGATLREEVDLTQLSEQLVLVVKETMQPSHVSLWLRHSEPTFDTPRYTRHLRI